MPDNAPQAFHVMAKPTGASCNLFAHTERPMRLMAAALQRGGYADEVMATLAEEARTTGRNNACPCGSGKKYKRCCGAPGS